jgi:prepilin-type N-terminal cleavage/methylation domain-containing protein
MKGIGTTGNTRRVRRRAGFSLVELSIVILIFSTVAVLGLEVLSKMLDRKAYATTQAQLAALDDALVKFYRVYGRLPCPADKTWATNNTGYGLEGACGGTADLTNGMIPFRTLNLPQSSAIDAYGNRINYTVTRLLTTSSATFTLNDAKVEVRSGILQQPCSTNCTVLANPATSDGAAYIIFSSGEDKRGAVRANGTTPVACYTATSDIRIDAQNCANGALTVGIPNTVYYDSRYNNGGQAANYFDDIVVWRTKGRIM